MLFAWRELDDIARPTLLARLSPPLSPPKTSRCDKRLAERMNCQTVRAPGSNVTLVPAKCAGSGASNSGSIRTVPVNQSEGPLSRAVNLFEYQCFYLVLLVSSQFLRGCEKTCRSIREALHPLAKPRCQHLLQQIESHSGYPYPF